MFCPKCGTKAIDGAGFCQKCGSKLIVDTVTGQQAATQTIQGQPNSPQSKPAKSKTFKLPIVIGAIAAVVVLAIAFITLNWEGKTDYQGAICAYAPYAHSGGLPYTCGEIFDRYIPDAKWKVHENSDSVYVDIVGTAKGTGEKAAVTMQVSEDPRDPNLFAIVPVSVKIGKLETSAQNETEAAFFALFFAYSEDMNSLSGFEDLLSSIEASFSGNVDLSEMYTSDAEGFSFRYPSQWELNDMIDPGAKDLAGFSPVCTIAQYSPFTAISVYKNTDPNYSEMVFAADAEFASAFGYDAEAVTNLKLSVAELNGIQVRIASYVMLEESAVQSYFYLNGAAVYKVEFSCPKNTAKNNEGLFRAIMDSYTVVPSNSTGNMSGDLQVTMVDDASTNIVFRSDGTFTMTVNLYGVYGILTGSYSGDGTNLYCSVEETSYQATVDGIGGFEDIGYTASEFMMSICDDTMIYVGEEMGTITNGSVFS